MLSPVSMASLTMAEPESRIMSHGRDRPSGTFTTSPGTNYELSISYTVLLAPNLSIWQVNLAISRIWLLFLMVSTMVRITEPAVTTKMQPE
jgi:hypothetical protein